MNRKFQKCPDAILAISQEVAQITSRCIYPYPMVGADAPSLFAKVLIPDTDTIPEWEQPDSTNPYAKGDKVTHNGKTWISTADGNVWEPGVYGWEEV